MRSKSFWKLHAIQPTSYDKTYSHFSAQGTLFDYIWVVKWSTCNGHGSVSVLPVNCGLESRRVWPEVWVKVLFEQCILKQLVGWAVAGGPPPLPPGPPPLRSGRACCWADRLTIPHHPQSPPLLRRSWGDRWESACHHPPGGGSIDRISESHPELKSQALRANIFVHPGLIKLSNTIR